MELLRLYTTNASQTRINLLYDAVNQELIKPTAQQIGKKIMIKAHDDSLSCLINPDKYKSKKDAPIIFHTIAQGIAEYTMTHIERSLLRQLIRHAHKQYESQEVAIIEEYCLSIINHHEVDAGSSRTTRKAKLAAAFNDYLATHHVMNVDGFIQFRMPRYKEELLEVVNYAVEEYIMDRQYQEFITLLQYFVLLQDKKVSEVHIIHKEGSNFIILDEHFQPIEKKKTEDFVMALLDKDLNYEDMVISSLISISPGKISIHTREKELQIIKTIQQIFENRTVICEQCHVCLPVHEQFSLDH